ncbi:bifunctional UDP-N-acetylglucosamine diphosphorylase/glucosamine-1-phosphate N-acetyltransferase GlmU [Acetanaerobacterium elongatum]|uniref:Bifunctional protein GlmU n=1 Tax=Acetanaerobacterium elongatum TaxID=258515 RepID=A0A1G9ZUM4_9FIRM|nr:bifunctional UDP-N-acetylglucosamine diphosphorylase/glucosamine-1-phosphate N-acetyltransferase GlmU [Acetanaerobacterium elongatum]SDN25332.1 bifunctional UDP-N-acetylglucosamine pyrophosphorylase / Glucosamine-1-phosphate N-acetyltransferase [Acetanaerobacterium elongatum]
MGTAGAIILAAGEGKRMKSASPKPMLEVLFKPMAVWVTDAVRQAGIEDLCIVCPQNDKMQEFFSATCKIAVQREKLGTGHAVMQARSFIEQHMGGEIVVLNGDAPFCGGETIRAAREFHIKRKNDVTVITARVKNPFGYGRIVRGNGGLERIVEQKDADAETALISEINSGAYVFNAHSLLTALNGLTNQNAAGEFYLTDTIDVILRNGGRADAFDAQDEQIVLGANDPIQLYELNRIANEKSIRAQMEKGVRFVSLDGVVIAADAQIGPDTDILPGTIIKPGCIIGSGCTIGPNTLIENSRIGSGTVINASQVYGSRVGDKVKIGPFTQLRVGCDIKDGAKIGDFVEVKNSVVGEKTSIAHLTYIGDSDVGGGVNFGCGVVTVNYDGKNKYRTTIGNNAFVGCNTNLIAPVTVGDGAYIAAGSTITEDVESGDMAIARARQVNKKGYANGRYNKK